MMENFIPAKGNHVILRGDALNGGLVSGLIYSDAAGYGSLILKEGKEGVFVSPVYKAEKPFNDIVASWNADTPEGTECEIYGRLYLPQYDGITPAGSFDGWTDWISWGRWSTHIARSCPVCEDSHPRFDSIKEQGWAFAYSMDGGGDSSVNTRGTDAAAAFQLKAVLRADEDATGRPSLRLLAATWKNTLIPNWSFDCVYPEESVPEKPYVLLDTPAISQKKRDPDYGGVICSATSAAMAMNGLGADLLPEDVTLANYDYGFGGNGNWSFTCAAAGAYGFESYVSYCTFEGLRMELSKGNAVCLSVKYSNVEDDKELPYMANTTGRTHGHLICVVGYYYNESMGDWVYYTNDPAGKDDLLVGPREYRQTHLDKAWYRRATYIIHKADLPGCGDNARKYLFGTLVRTGKENAYALLAGDEKVAIPRDFLKGRRESFGGHGTLCWYAEKDVTKRAAGRRICTANHDFRYDGLSVAEEGEILFENDEPIKRAEAGEKIHFLMIDNSNLLLDAVFMK